MAERRSANVDARSTGTGVGCLVKGRRLCRNVKVVAHGSARETNRW